MSKPYANIHELILMIDEPNRECCQRIHKENQELFDASVGSAIKHQWWEGGYIDHLEEIMNIAVQVYTTLDSCRPLPFSLSDALLILFLHDLEKPWYYSGVQEYVDEVKKFERPALFAIAMAQKYGFELTEEIVNGIIYAHGEGKDYHPTDRVQTPVAAFIHCCDTMSARIWFNEPQTSGRWTDKLEA